MVILANRFISFFLFFVLLSFLNCSDDGNSEQTTSLDENDLVLVWSDEFNGNTGTLPDSKKWTYDIGGNGWGNQELQFYTNRSENVSLDGNGNLAITAIKESYSNADYTSARIKTQGLFTTTYGKIEANIKLPVGQGIWPAFWMLGNDIESVGWPQCGEIDIMEYRGQQPSKVHGSVHGPGYSAGNAITGTYTLWNDQFYNDFHKFSVEWNTNLIKYYVDDVLYKIISVNDVNEWVFDHPFFILLNLAVGGTFVGAPNDQTPFPQTMLVDYIRVYN